MRSTPRLIAHAQLLLWFGGVLLLAAPAQPQGVSELFTFDTPEELEPGGFWSGRLSTPGGGVVTWDPVEGNSTPGSVRIEAVVGVLSNVVVISECLPINGGPWEIEASFRGNGLCNMGLLAFRQPDCSDPIDAVFADQYGASSGWQTESLTFPAGAQRDYEHLRLRIGHVGTSYDIDPHCLFDDVQINGPPPPPPIPTLSGGALTVLILLVGLAGLGVLRMR